MLFDVVGAGMNHEVQLEGSEETVWWCCPLSEMGVTEYVFVTVTMRTLVVEEEDSVCSLADCMGGESSGMPTGSEDIVPMTSSVKLCSGNRFTRLPEASAPGSVPVRVRVSTVGTTSSEEVVVTVLITLYVLLEAGSKKVVVYVSIVE